MYLTDNKRVFRRVAMNILTCLPQAGINFLDQWMFSPDSSSWEIEGRPLGLVF